MPTLYAVRTTTHKLVKYPNHPEWMEVFDLAADPYEIKNLASDTALTANLEAELETLIRAADYTVPSSSHRLRVRSETNEFTVRTMSLL